MNHEYLTPHPEDLATISPEVALNNIFVEVVDKATGTKYEIGFIFQHPHGQYIKIESPKRKEFLQQGTEEEAEAALHDFAQKVRTLTGGSFNIHPFYGAVYGTKQSRVYPEFGSNAAKLDDELSMTIYLTDAGKIFDEDLTRRAQRLGSVVVFGTPAGNELLDYSKTPKTNPNQEDADIASKNGLRRKWDAEFDRVNAGKQVAQAMTLTLQNVITLLKQLQGNDIIHSVALKSSYPNN